MDWPKVESTVRHAYYRNGSGYEAVTVRTPLAELIEKDSAPDLEAMTEGQLEEFAEGHNISLADALDRTGMIAAIKQALEINWEERVRGMMGMLRYIFADGPHPLALNRRTYAIAKAICPDLILNMSAADLAVLCDDGKGRSSDGRATVCARVDRIYNEPIRKAGMHGTKAPFQKTQSHGEACSDAQRGNQNRRGKDYIAHQKKVAA